jgi:hypothetical protein
VHRDDLFAELISVHGHVYCGCALKRDGCFSCHWLPIKKWCMQQAGGRVIQFILMDFYKLDVFLTYVSF